MADALGVEVEKRLAQRLVFGVVGLDAERRVHQPARARRSERAQALERQRLLALVRRMRFTAAARSGAVSASVPSKSKRTARLGITRAAQQVVHVAVGAEPIARA